MSSGLKDPNEGFAFESPSHHAVFISFPPRPLQLSMYQVDGAIVHARNRMSLLRNQIANLSMEVLRSSDLEGTEGNAMGLNKVPISHTIEAQSIPLSGELSDDYPEPTARDLGKHPFQRSSHEESMELDSQWKDSEAETYSEDHDPIQPVLENQDASSTSSWSMGRSIGFGVSTSDQMLLRNLARGSKTKRRQEMSSPDAVEDLRILRRKDEDSQTWILNCLLPFSCWPKEDTTMELRLQGRDGISRSSRNNKTNQNVRVPHLAQAVRNAIGKMWDEYSSEMAQDICELVSEFLSPEDDGILDAEACWVSGRALASASCGLPFAFTIHTFSSLCKPCMYGHANVIAEISSMDGATADIIQKIRTESEQRAYGLVSTESYNLPEAVIDPLQRTWDRLPPKAPHLSQLRATRSFPSRMGNDAHSTFSFNSTKIRKEKRETRLDSTSTETLSTADLTAFIRANENANQRRRRASIVRRTESQPADTNMHSSEHDEEPHIKAYSVHDLIWDMHYPDFNNLDNVIASRTLRFNEERTMKTYLGDTDSEEESTDGKDSAHLDDLFRPESPTQFTLENKNAIVPYESENNDEMGTLRPQFFDSDPWGDVGILSNDNDCLTQSMEVNLGEEEETTRKWGRIRRLSGLVKRVTRILGSSSSDGRRNRDHHLPTIPDSREVESDGEEYYTCTNHSPTAMLPSRSASPSPRRRTFLENAKRSERPLMESYTDMDRERHASVDSASGALSERNLMIAPSQALVTTNLDSVQSVLWEEPKSIKLPIKDLGNGLYVAMGHLTGPGDYKLMVRIGKKKLHDMPKTISVVDPATLGSGISDDGPFFQVPDSPVLPSASTKLTPHPDYPPCHSVAYDPERLDYAQRHRHVGHVDMVFIVDCTTSMGTELRQLPTVVAKIEELVKEAALCKRLRMGVIAYRDHHPEDEDNFLLRKHDLTENLSRVRHFISKLEADGGNDYPEAMEVAFEEAVEGIRWSPFSARFIIWVGDAPPHGYQGFHHKEAIEEEKKFKEAKARLKKAAYSVDVAMMNNASPRQLNALDRNLAEALESCDMIGKFHDKYPLGIPGRVRWEEAIERVSSMGARVLALGFRNSVAHQASSNCLRTIAHISGGALLEVTNLDATVVGPLTVAIIEQALDQQLLEEEVCDLILCFKNDFEHQSKDDRRRSLVESMSQASKQPHRLQALAMHSEPKLGHGSSHGSVAYSDGGVKGLFRPDSRSTGEPSSSVGPLSISKGSFDVNESRELITVDPKENGSMLLGMMAIRFDDRVLDQVLESLRNKAERTSRCFLSNFESPEQWLEFHSHQPSDGLYRRERDKISGLTSPLSLRYIVATHIVSVDKQ